MPYITREDGEHFVIPSYRDVLSAKKKSTLKRDILLLSQKYGEYITLQRKNPTQYEVAFSPDTGYLLGESVWHFFKKPLDMIYCEVIPNTTEAILVIVKAGSVYLDGSFPLDTIAEELIIFLTQQNNFEIYTYGNVPIAQTPEEGKFSFEPNSVKSFTILDTPVFPTLPLLRTYQLQLVDSVLRSHGIGVFPVKQLIMTALTIGCAWLLYSYLTAPKPIEKQAAVEVNPFQAYNAALSSSAPDQEINAFLNKFNLLFTLPGWSVEKVNYTPGSLSAAVKSLGNTTQSLLDWAQKNNAKVSMQPSGIFVAMNANLPKRPLPTKIYPLKEVLARFIDRLASVYPGNHLVLGNFVDKEAFTQVTVTINIDNVTPLVLALIGKQFKDLPLVLKNVALTFDKGLLSGSIAVDVFGN